jgi:hypothetical protein
LQKIYDFPNNTEEYLNTNKKRVKFSNKDEYIESELKFAKRIPKLKNKEKDSKKKVKSILKTGEKKDYDLSNLLVNEGESKSEVNISDFDFDEVYNEVDDPEFSKQIGMQKLNYLISQMEDNDKYQDEMLTEDLITPRKEENTKIKKQKVFTKEKKESKMSISNKSLSNTSNTNNRSTTIRNRSKSPLLQSPRDKTEMCRKFKENPLKFFSNPPSEYEMRALKLQQKKSIESNSEIIPESILIGELNLSEIMNNESERKKGN